MSSLVALKLKKWPTLGCVVTLASALHTGANAGGRTDCEPACGPIKSAPAPTPQPQQSRATQNLQNLGNTLQGISEALRQSRRVVDDDEINEDEDAASLRRENERNARLNAQRNAERSRAERRQRDQEQARRNQEQASRNQEQARRNQEQAVRDQEAQLQRQRAEQLAESNRLQRLVEEKREQLRIAEAAERDRKYRASLVNPWEAPTKVAKADDGTPFK